MHHLVGVRHVGRDEVHPGLNQAVDEVNIAGEAVEFGNQQSSAGALAHFKREAKLWALFECVGTPFAGLHLAKLPYGRSTASSQVLLDNGALCASSPSPAPPRRALMLDA